MSRSFLLTPMLLGVLAGGGCAAVDAILPKGQTEEWKEVEAGLPSWPREENLASLDTNVGGRGNRVLVDVDSLSKEKDEIVRYTAVIRTPGGAENVIYEGLRCSTKHAKAYAYGYRGTFRAFEDPQWERITGSGAYGYRHALLGRYLCDHDGLPRKRSEIVLRLRHGFFGQAN